jgi:DNA repair exonuclease SbcCD ATPase subunit
MDALQELSSLEPRLRAAQARLNQRKGEMRRLEQERAEAQAQLQAALTQADLLEKVSVLLSLTSQHARAQAKQQIEVLVTNTLRHVFGGPYAFKIDLVEKAGRPEAEFYVVSPGEGGQMIESRPQESRGGGVVDVVALGLRMAMLETYQPPLDGPMILDEPAKHVSEEYVAPAANFLTAISDFFGRQVIMVTHNPHLAETAGVAYNVVLRDGVSQVSRAR